MAGGGGISECFVAREDELSALHGALREARDGRPVVVAIEGEPGIGKTTLLRRFLAGVPDVETLWASGDETEVSLDHGISSQLWSAMPPGVQRGRRPGVLRERLRIGWFRSGRRAPGRVRRTAATGSRRHCRRRPAVGRPPLGPGPAVRYTAVAQGQRAGAADEPPAQPRPARRQLVTLAQPASAAPAAGRIGSGRSASAGQYPVWPRAIARCTGTALRAHWRQPALRPGPARGASGQRAGRRTQPAAAARPALLRRHRDHQGGAAVGCGPEPARSRKRHWPPLFLAARGAGGWDRRRRGRA